MCMSSYCYVPSCQVSESTASPGPEQAMLICYGDPQGMFDPGPGSLPRLIKRGGRTRQVVKSHLPELIIGWRCDGGSFLRLILFRLVAHPLQPGVVGSFAVMGYMVPQPFVAGVNRSYLEFWAVIAGPWYPGIFLQLSPPSLPLSR
jgi:hypothetical protein